MSGVIVMQDKQNEFYKRLDWYHAQGDLYGVEQFLLECANQPLKNPQEDQEDRISIYNELGSLYRGTGRYAQSLDVFEKARTLAADSIGTNCSQYATILNNMAGSYRLVKDYAHATAAFLEAVRIYQQEGEQESYSYASVLNNLSLVYQETRQFDKAIQYLEQALALIETMPDHQHEIAVTYNNLTALYHASGDTQQAMFCLNRALQEFEKCPDDERVHYAAVLNSLAGFLYGEGDYERALMLYRQSAKYTKRFFGENEEYGTTFQNMRWVYEKLGRQEDAIAALDEAKRVYTRLLGPDHERTCCVADELRHIRENNQ